MVVPVSRTRRCTGVPPPSPWSVSPDSPTAHAPPGNAATAPKALSCGSPRGLNVVQAAPFQCAATAFSGRTSVGCGPTAQALPGDKAETATTPPGGKPG